MDVALIVTPNVVKDTQICTSNLLAVPTKIPEGIPGKTPEIQRIRL